MFKKINGYIKIDTLNTTLLLREDNIPELVYYGKKISSDNEFTNYDYGKNFNMLASASDYCGNHTVISCSGDGNNRETMLHAVDKDGNASVRLKLKGVKVLLEKPEIPNMPTSFGSDGALVLVYEDEFLGMIVEQYFATYPNSDVISTALAIKNAGKKEFYLRRALSMQLDFDDGDYKVTSLTGTWGRERKAKSSDLNAGCTSFSSFLGLSSNAVNPFVTLTKKGKNGFSVASNLVYSGNHKEFFDRTVLYGVRMATGINDYLLNYPVLSGETFYTPEAVFVYGANEEDVSFAMRSFVSSHVIPKKWQNVERPIVINSWESFLFTFNEKRLMDLCDVAHDVGIETFVLDDGWFGKRDDDTNSLGDWYANENKLGGTIGRLADKIREHGLEFGIWVEPEMISKDSELFRKHPDYALTIDGVNPITIRSQWVIDVTKKEVRDYLVERVCAIVEESKATYLKWDCNRGISELKGSGRLFHDFVLGTYDIFKRITKKFPNLLIESCASGGNRFDLGLLCYAPQVWTSDCADARQRVFIQEGTLKGYPLSTISAHVAYSPSHHTFNKTALKDRFAIAAQGVTGYELNLSARPKEELKEISRQTAFYKKWRSLFQFGDFYEGEGTSDDKFLSWTVVAKDKSRAVTTGVSMYNDYGVIPNKIISRGLDMDAKYKVNVIRRAGDEPTESFVATGDMLVNAGIFVGNLFDMKTLNENSNSIATVMITMEKI